MGTTDWHYHYPSSPMIEIMKEVIETSASGFSNFDKSCIRHAVKSFARFDDGDNSELNIIQRFQDYVNDSLPALSTKLAQNLMTLDYEQGYVSNIVYSSRKFMRAITSAASPFRVSRSFIHRRADFVGRTTIERSNPRHPQITTVRTITPDEATIFDIINTRNSPGEENA